MSDIVLFIILLIPVLLLIVAMLNNFLDYGRLPGYSRRSIQRRLQFQLQDYGLASVAEGLHYARKALEREDDEAAAEFCSRILAVDALNSEALYLRAQACYRLGEYLAALHDLRTLLRNVPDHTQANTLYVVVNRELTRYETAV